MRQVLLLVGCFGALVLALSTLMLLPACQMSGTDNIPALDVRADLLAAKGEAEQKLKFARRDFGDDSIKFRQLRDLYIEASSKNNGLVQAISENIRNDSPIAEDQLARAVSLALDSRTRFLDGARAASGSTKDPLLAIPLVTGFLDSGIKMIEQERQRADGIRKTAADQMLQYKWSDIDDLK